MVINNINDLASYLGTSTKWLEHDLYRNTDCGAWITWDNHSVTIGSIVEGSNAEFSRTLDFPFSSMEYEDWMEELEALTSEAWEEANGSEEGGDSI